MNYFPKELHKNPLAFLCLLCLCKGAWHSKRTSKIGVLIFITLRRCLLGDNLSPFPFYFLCDSYNFCPHHLVISFTHSFLSLNPIKLPFFFPLLVARLLNSHLLHSL